MSGARHGDASVTDCPHVLRRLAGVCGICGIASARGAVDRDRLAAMSATLAHRGPDSEGTFADGGVGLAARRLAIIDLAGGDQPIANEDGTCTVVQNGEIYNFAELRRELERAGHRFRTGSDTEVLVHGYEQWGLGFAERLRGMFAVAIWDARERRLVLARDRFGIKPLYYRDVAGELAFASELDALPKGELDLDAVEAFLAFNSIPAPLSIFREIRKLPPGHVLTWSDGRVELERFARPGPLPPRDGRGRGRACRGVPGAAARLGARAPRLRRAGRRPPLGRRRLGDARGARRAGELRAGADVLDRVRGGVVRRARGRARGRGAVRDSAPRARAAAGRGAPPPGARGRVRRAVRGLLGAADVPRLAARGRRREGRALGRGRRRALRRLLHVRRRPARRAGRAARRARASARRPAAELEPAREHRVPREAVHARRRTCRRSSATTAGRRSSPRTRGPS